MGLRRKWRSLDDGRLVPYPFGELDEIVLAYATTIHKSQGSEYPAVVNPIVTQHYAMLQRNLLYTGMTRGKRLVVLVGQKFIVIQQLRRSRRYFIERKLSSGTCQQFALVDTT
jgi:ATP-dependent exoDNAse (exonuclease V) alpha subunit